MNALQLKIICLFNEANSKINNVLSPGEAEPEMINFLHFVRDHPEERSFTVELFKRSLTVTGASWEFLQFCFHGLRWPEMQEFVKAGLQENRFDMRARAVWSHLLESFDNDWEDAEFYQEFSHAT